MSPHLDVLGRREGVAHEVLQDEGDAAAQLVEREGAQVDAVDRDAPLDGVVEARQELHDRGLAGAVLAHQRHHLAGADPEVEAADRPALRLGVAEADALEADAVADGRGERQGVGGRADRRDDVEEREEVIEVGGLGGELREPEQQALEQPAEPEQRAGEEAEVADRDVAAQRPPQDGGIAGVVGQRAQRGEEPAPERAPRREPARLAVHQLGEDGEAAGEEALQPEELDLLGGLDAGAEG